MPRLSVIIPVYNEKNTIVKILDLVQAAPVDKEIVVVDDGSSDGTRALIREYSKGCPALRVIFHEKNIGKGRAIRTGIEAASGDCILIQDADLEYDPADYSKLLEALDRSGANAVYGSRFMDKRGVTAPWHRFVNFVLTGLTNLLFSSNLTDMETCYKLFRAPFMKKLPLRSDGFEIEVELTARVLKMKERILEIPISYKGRNFHEGKKIGWKDGFKAFFLIFRYRFS